jgi:protein-tyrosine kinase
MEPIKKAIERLRSKRPAEFNRLDFNRLDQGRPAPRQPVPVVGRASRDSFVSNQVPLDLGHLEAHRIVGHDSADPRSMPFDMLRTQLLQATDRKKWQFVGITSPTPGCGKTFVAVNLALSIARHPERSPLLVDMDLLRPRVATYLGLGRGHGLIDVLQDEASIEEAIQQVSVGAAGCSVLPGGHPAPDSAGWMASRAMSDILDELKRNYRSRIVLVDLPPVLSSDDVITILPQIDCILLVVAAGVTTPQQIEDCGRHLQSADVVRVVLNKAPDSSMTYQGDY